MDSFFYKHRLGNNVKRLLLSYRYRFEIIDKLISNQLNKHSNNQSRFCDESKMDVGKDSVQNPPDDGTEVLSIDILDFDSKLFTKSSNIHSRKEVKRFSCRTRLETMLSKRIKAV